MMDFFETPATSPLDIESAGQHLKSQVSNASTEATALDSNSGSNSSSRNKNRETQENQSSSLLIAESQEGIQQQQLLQLQRLSDRSSKKKKKKKDNKKKKRKSSRNKAEELAASAPNLLWDAGTTRSKEKGDDWSEWDGDSQLFPDKEEALNHSMPASLNHPEYLPPSFGDQQSKKSASAHQRKSAYLEEEGIHLGSAPTRPDSDDLVSALSARDMDYQLTAMPRLEEEAPLDMMAQYMISMGTDRQTAKTVAEAFAAEQRASGTSRALSPFVIDETATLVSALSNDDTRSFIQSSAQAHHDHHDGDDMLAQYMVAMGTDRDTAQKLAAAFANEQQNSARRASTGNATRRRSQASTSMLQQKAQEAAQQRPVHRSASMPLESMHPPPRRTSSIHSQSPDLVHAPPRPYVAPPPPPPQRRVSSQTRPPPPAYSHPSASIVEARPVKEDYFAEEGAPVIYAESTPISLKHLIRERPVRRFFMVAACLLIAGVIGGVLYYVLGRGNSDALSSVLTASPTMAPSMAPTFILLETYQAALKLSGEEALNEPDSPQLKAVGWMSSVDTVDTGGYDRAFEQRYALTTMFYSLGGEEWTNPDEWLNPTMHECDWGGLFCGFDATETRVVTGLDATRNNLRGTLPAEIGLLTSTELLRMPRNRINGTIPTSIGNLASLSSIDLNSNEFTGPIPSTIGDMQDLIVINFSNNKLKGSMPERLYTLKVLRTLILSDNSISGLLTQGVNNLTLLATLDLRHNQFTGSFPITFASLPALDLVWLDYNQFSGPLPMLTGELGKRQTLSLSYNNFEGNIEVDLTTLGTTTIGDFRLQHVDVSYNKLAGPISRVVGFLPTMRYIDFSGNLFTGAFPETLGWPNVEFFASSNNLLNGTLPTGLPRGLTSLTHFDVSSNQFTGGIQEAYCEYENLEFLILSNNTLGGSMPSCLFEMEKLRDLELSDVLLNGTIPSEIGQLTYLEHLFLSGNSLEGDIPTQMGNLGEMKKLELDRNSLSSSIPSELSKMTDLVVLNLEENNLDGVFPWQLQSLGELQSLHLAGNGISGAIPEELCQLGTLNLTQQALGCNIWCSCCGDAGAC